MAKQSEIISIFSAGISYRRFLVPYFIGSIFLALLLYFGNHYVIPHSNKKKNEFEIEVFKKKKNKTTVGSNPHARQNIHFYLSKNEKIYVHRYRDLDTVAQTFRLETFSDLGTITKIVKGDRLSYNADSNTWTMKNYEVRSINGMKESIKQFPNLEKDTTINLQPSDFIRYTKQKEMLATPELRAFISQERDRGIDSAASFLVELHRRSAHPFTLIILTILGASIASRKVRGGMGIHIAIGVILGAMLEVLSKFSMTFSSNLGMSPFLGVWFPNIVFIFITYYIVRNTQK